MFLFLGTILEQLDVALEHVQKRDVHNARFSLMLSDNLVELVLHQIAKDLSGRHKMYQHLRDKYPHTDALEKALGRAFDAKVRLAKLEGALSEELAQSITTVHEYRNQVYHVGLHHEEILIELAAFHFDLTCEFVGRFRPYNMYWGSNMRMPERAKQYFEDDGFMPGSVEQYQSACEALRGKCGYDPGTFIETLADHMDDTVSMQDACLDTVAQGVYEGQQRTRDRAITQTQAWSVAFNGKGKKFADENGFPGGSHFEFVDWIEKNYPFTVKSDPIPSWEKRAEALRADRNPHSALHRYQSFMDQTSDLREEIYESAAGAEAEIDMAIDRARGL